MSRGASLRALSSRPPAAGAYDLDLGGGENFWTASGGFRMEDLFQLPLQVILQ